MSVPCVDAPSPDFGQGRSIKTTTSLCPSCLARVEAEVFERHGEVWMDKRCTAHGPVHLHSRGDRILGATVVCRQAGEVIAQLGLAMQMGLGLSAAAQTVYPYPTRNELVSRLADAYNFEAVGDRSRRLAKLWFRWGLR